MLAAVIATLLARTPADLVPGPARPTLFVPASAVSLHGQMERVFVAGEGEACLHSDQGETHLAFGDVVVAEPSDGSVRVQRGKVLWLSEIMA